MYALEALVLVGKGLNAFSVLFMSELWKLAGPWQCVILLIPITKDS
jgi:hypothetical protein